jgi:hypothetical protein
MTVFIPVDDPDDERLAVFRLNERQLSPRPQRRNDDGDGLDHWHQLRVQGGGHQRHRRYAFPFDIVHPFRDCVSVNTVVRVLRPRHAMLRGAPTPTNSQTSAIGVPVAHPCFALSVACRVCVGSVASLSAVHRRPLRRGSDEEISISISLDDLRRGSDEEKREDLI